MRRFLGFILMVISVGIIVLPYIPDYLGYELVSAGTCTTTDVSRGDLCIIDPEKEIEADDLVYFKQQQLFNTVGKVELVGDGYYEIYNMSELIDPEYMMGKIIKVVPDMGILWLYLTDIEGKIAAAVLFILGLILLFKPKKNKGNKGDKNSRNNNRNSRKEEKSLLESRLYY